MTKSINCLAGSPLRGLPVIADFRSKRSSSWDRTGGNKDFITIEPGANATIADITGTGQISHIWITAGSEDKYYLRNMLIRMYWDGESDPSVDSPLGDFFGVGHAIANHFMSLPLNMVGITDPAFNRAAMNCFFPMPFSQSAKVEIVNQGPIALDNFFYYVDYELGNELSENLGRFHAKWRRDNPTKAQSTRVNLDGKYNYVILEAEGKGHYVGCNISIDNLSTAWPGEGDDMIFIDGEEFPPSLHGTGTEDYFCAAWGFPGGEYSGPYHGVSLAGSTRDYTGKWTAYRFHIEDPIRFQKSIRVSIEHGHANDRADDYSSVAYWYQTEPHKNFYIMPGPKKRLPRDTKVAIQ